MSELLHRPPYGPRDDEALLRESIALARRHLEGCPEYSRVWPHWNGASCFEDLPFLHVGLFKHVTLRTHAPDVRHERTLRSSSTTGANASRIVLDRDSSARQTRSTGAILREFVGEERRPLAVIDSARSLIARGEVSARIAAAMSLQPLAIETHFLLDDASDPASMRWERLAQLIEQHRDLLVYGFTWILWLAWGASGVPAEVRSALAGARIHFVHSGGWKKLEEAKVDRATLDHALLDGLDPGSRVVDFYGLVEQVGVVYPLCECGYRHVPVWAGVIVRDPFTLQPLGDGPGQLQLFNCLAGGAPYHSVLTEDMGRLVPGECSAGRSGPRFELLGRVPKADVRGCANV